MRPILVLPLLLAACGGTSEAPGINAVDINAAAIAAQDSIEDYAANTATPAALPARAATSLVVMPTPAPVETPSAPPTDALRNDQASLSDAAVAPHSAQAAADLVRTYYALLGDRQYDQAGALWGHDGSDSGMTRSAFAASFAKFREYRADIGTPGGIDAGMSQRWVTVPVQVHGRLTSGGPFALSGSVTLHRIVAGVGTDAAAERWSIQSADLKPRPPR